jgi:excisionase family DNA binding protein
MTDRSTTLTAVLAEAEAIRRSGEQISQGMADIAQAITSLAVVLTTGDQELLRVMDAAKILGVSNDTVRRAIRSGSLPAVKIGPEKTALRIRRSDLAAYAASLT